MNVEQTEACAKRAMERLSAAVGITEDVPVVSAEIEQVTLAFAGTGVPGPETVLMLTGAAHAKAARLVMEAASSGGVIDLESELRAVMLEVLLIGIELGREARRLDDEGGS